MPKDFENLTCSHPSPEDAIKILQKENEQKQQGQEEEEGFTTQELGQNITGWKSDDTFLGGMKWLANEVVGVVVWTITFAVLLIFGAPDLLELICKIIYKLWKYFHG